MFLYTFMKGMNIGLVTAVLAVDAGPRDKSGSAEGLPHVSSEAVVNNWAGQLAE